MVGPDQAGHLRRLRRRHAGRVVARRRSTPVATAAVRVDRRLGARAGRPDARAEVRVYADDHDVDAALRRGRQLRAEIDEAADRSACWSSPTVPHPHPARARRLRPGLDPRPGRARRRAGRGRRRRAHPAAGRDRRPGGLSGAGRADRRRRRGRRRSCTAARRTASATSSASGNHDAADRDRRPDRHRQIGAGTRGRRAGRRRDRECRRDAALPRHGHRHREAAAGERRGIPHHQLDVLEVTETATVARYQQAAADDIEAIAARGAVPIVVGGSMMYIQSLLDDWTFPATDPLVRARWEQRLAEVGVGGLQPELARVDADAAASILPTDGRRIVRALEVVELTGQPFAASFPAIGAPRWDTAIVGLDWETTLLDDRLTRRTDKMFADGLVQEVHALLAGGLRDGVTASRLKQYFSHS